MGIQKDQIKFFKKIVLNFIMIKLTTDLNY